MAPEGIIVLVIYHGHPEGAVERIQLLQYVKASIKKKPMFCNTSLLTKKITHHLSWQSKKDTRPIISGHGFFSCN